MPTRAACLPACLPATAPIQAPTCPCPRCGAPVCSFLSLHSSRSTRKHGPTPTPLAHSHSPTPTPTPTPTPRCGAPALKLQTLVFKLDTTCAAAIQQLCNPSTGAYLGPIAHLHVANSGSMPLDVRLPAGGSVCVAEGEPCQLAGLMPGDARAVRMRMHPTALSSAQLDPVAVRTNSVLQRVVKLPVRVEWTRARVEHVATLSSAQLAAGGAREASLQLRNTGNAVAKVAVTLASTAGLVLSWPEGYTPPEVIPAGKAVTARLVMRAPPGGPSGHQHASIDITTANDLDLTVSMRVWVGGSRRVKQGAGSRSREEGVTTCMAR
jgi:hypothetical protein